MYRYVCYQNYGETAQLSEFKFCLYGAMIHRLFHYILSETGSVEQSNSDSESAKSHLHFQFRLKSLL